MLSLFFVGLPHPLLVDLMEMSRPMGLAHPLAEDGTPIAAALPSSPCSFSKRGEEARKQFQQNTLETLQHTGEKNLNFQDKAAKTGRRPILESVRDGGQGGTRLKFRGSSPRGGN